MNLTGGGTETIIGIVAVLAGLTAELLRRRWKKQDRKEENKRENDQARADAWDRDDPGGVFNPKK